MKHTLFFIVFISEFFAQASAQLNLDWHKIGPDNFAGIARAILIDNRDSTHQTIYAGAAGGGIWKSTDRGTDWVSLGCLRNYAVSCMSQASDGTIYYGTGLDYEFFSNEILDENIEGYGIFKILPNDIIVHLDATNVDSFGISPWNVINDIAINPLNPSAMIAATYTGLYQSQDSGNTWSAIELPGILHTLQNKEAEVVKWAGNGNNIYASVGGQYNGYMLTSSNGGTTWNEITNPSNPGFPAAELGRIAIALAPSNDSIIYISIAATSNGCTYAVYGSADAGSTWTDIVNKGPSFDPMTDGCQGWYDNTIAVSPADSSKIYVGGVTLYSYSPSTGSHQIDSIFNSSLPNYVFPDKFTIVIDNNNPDVMYIGTEGGIFKSTNAYSSFTAPDFTFLDNTFMPGFASLSAAKNGTVVGGSFVGPLGFVLFDCSGPKLYSAKQIHTGIGLCYISRLDSNAIFISGYGDSYLRSFNNGMNFSNYNDSVLDTACNNSIYENYPYFLLSETKSAFNSTDSVWFIANTNYTAGNLITGISKTANTPFNFTLSSVLNIGDSIKIVDPVKSRVFTSSQCGQWMTPDALDSFPKWYKLANIQGTVVSFASSKNGDILYAGTQTGFLYKLSSLNSFNYDSLYGTNALLYDSPAYLFADTLPNYNSETIMDISVDINDSTHVVCTVAGFVIDTSSVFQTNDGGQSWQRVLRFSPDTVIYTCIVDGNNSNNLIAGTTNGIYYSFDRGVSWQHDDGELCNTIVRRLRQFPLYNEDSLALYAATDSRGLWGNFNYSPEGCTLSGINTIASKDDAFDFNLFPDPAFSVANIDVALNSGSVANITIYDITGRVISNTEKFIPAGESKITLDISSFASGTYLVNFRARNMQKTKLLVIGQ